ncbi:MAG TPA: hypothetical protein VNZ45_13105, partial [Bacteroidia bacterium]|nr:hypothetical protein [Bacteroidia bacterium]
MTGWFSDTAIFGHDTLVNNVAGYESFLAKYDSNGNVLWAKQTTGHSSDNYCEVSYLSTDVQGNVYLTGAYQDTVTFGYLSLVTSVNKANAFLAKYNSNGSIIWAKQPQFCISNTTSGNAVTTDASGNIFMTGIFQGILRLDMYKLYSPYTAPFLIKYDTYGNVSWAAQGYSQSSADSSNSNSVVTDKYGNIYITGNYKGNLTLDKYNLTTKLSANAFIAKYDANGNIKWVQHSADINNNTWSGNSVSCDTLNHIYLAMGCNDNRVNNNCVIAFGADSFMINGNKSGDVSGLIEFDTAGKAICGSLTTTGGDDLNTVACDPSGKYVYFGGDLWQPAVFGTDTFAFTDPEVPLLVRWQSCTTIIDTIPTDTLPP